MAFSGDIQRLQQAFDADFGPGFGMQIIPADKVVVLNKIPALDLAEEVIVDGQILGLLVFDPVTDEFHFAAKYNGGLRIFAAAHALAVPVPKCIHYATDGVPFLLQGKSIVAPAIQSLSGNLQNKDRCLLTCDEGYLGVGLVTQDASVIPTLMATRHGQIAKPREVHPPISADTATAVATTPRGQTLSDVLAANATHMQDVTHKAMRFIQRTRAQFAGMPVAVAYSGGKDSLCTLLLAWEALGPDFYVFFADTGLEMPEVLAHTQVTVDKLGLRDRFYQRSAGDKFWTLVEKFGPPARDFRYCCHSLKAQQITNIIHELAGDGQILVFLGQRRYESFSRAQERPVYSNSYIPAQISATPIKDWTAFEVWLYLLAYRIDGEPFPQNDLYFQGHERLGCYLCPSMNLATSHLLRATHPALMQRWDEFLARYSASMELPPEWVKYGLWRSKKFNKLWEHFAADLAIDLKPTVGTRALRTFCVTVGYAPCVKGGYSLKGKFDGPIDVTRLDPFLRTLPGKMTLHEMQGVASVQNARYMTDIFADGSLYVRFVDSSPAYQDVVYLLVGIVARAHGCTHCGVCAQVCPVHAITIQDDQIALAPATCTHCGQCTLLCPLFKLAARQVQWEEPEIL